MITPTFHFKILDSFVPVYESNSAIMVEKLAEKAKNNESFDICPFITLCALDIICGKALVNYFIRIMIRKTSIGIGRSNTEPLNYKEPKKGA